MTPPDTLTPPSDVDALWDDLGCIADDDACKALIIAFISRIRSTATAPPPSIVDENGSRAAWTSDECHDHSLLYQIAVVVTGDQPTAMEIANRSMDLMRSIRSTATAAERERCAMQLDAEDVTLGNVGVDFFNARRMQTRANAYAIRIRTPETAGEG